MKRTTTILFLSFLLSLSAFAQRDEKVIYGQVRDFLTGQVMKGVRVSLMDKDSVLIDTMNTSQDHGVYDKRLCWVFELVEGIKPEYIAKFEKKGYETAYLDFKFKPTKAWIYFISDVKMKRRREVALGEATVRATQVKFYVKDDTLVYNADAFQLAEGSMLDALIRQLPGVELKDDGRILVNGKYVESLLLNGEEFMRSDRSLMLDNLPAYMVKDVKVYDKTHWSTDDKTYVMDVRLKRKYSVGWIANAEGGLGTEDRYLGRFFGLRFTPQSRLTLFGNMNNLNESRKPGQNGEWTPEGMTTGQAALKNAGVDYLVKEKNGLYKLTGSATVSHTDADSHSRSIGTSFLPGGDEHTYGTILSRSCRTDFKTEHTFNVDREGRFYVIMMPSGSYSKWENTGLSASATLTEKPAMDAGALLDSISQPESGALLRRLALNRQRSEWLGRGTSWSASAYNIGFFRMRRSGDDLDIRLGGSYSRTSQEQYSHDLYEYPSRSEVPVPDFRSKYNEYVRKSGGYGMEANYKHTFRFKDEVRLVATAIYSFGQDFEEEDSPYYRLDWLDGWGADSPIGLLPSERAVLLESLDGVNSYYSKHRTTKQYLGASFDFYPRDKYLQIKASMGMRNALEHLDYLRAEIDTAFRRSTTYFQANVSGSKAWYKGGQNQKIYKRNELSSRYSGGLHMPSMVSQLNTLSNEDPLNVRVGNPDLKGSYHHEVGIYYHFNDYRRGRFLNASVDYSVSQDLVAYGFSYDPSTGVRTYRPENVNGNYDVVGRLGYTAPVDKGRKLTFGTDTEVKYFHNVDLVSPMDDGGAPLPGSRRSTVGTIWASETLKADWNLGKVKLGAKLSGAWHHADSERDGFVRINAATCRYGVSGQFELPWGFQLNTDLTLYSRRGYESRGMNTDDVVWNARLSKSFLPGGKLTVMLDGFDILHQLSSVMYSVNGQGQSEVYRNVIPRYFMAHVIYRINIQPKKRPGDE